MPLPSQFQSLSPRPPTPSGQGCKGPGDKPGSPLLGAHLSVAGGLENALYRAFQLGCDCVQLFVKNQRRWHSRPLTDDQVERFHAAMSATQLTLSVAHANYLLNLASPAEAIRRGSIEVLTDELTRCERLGVTYLVFHPGAHLANEATRRHSEAATEGEDRRARTESGTHSPPRRRRGSAKARPAMRNHGTAITPAEQTGIERIATSLDEIHARCAGFQSMLLLETTAGQGSAIGHRFEHLRAILDRVREPKRLGVCLDTCHLFAAGYDFRTPETYERLIAELDRVLGLPNVKCIHANDSKRPLGSRVDRHEHIGKGIIGKSGFARFLTDPRWRRIPVILETPKGTDSRGVDFDQINLKHLRDLMV